MPTPWGPWGYSQEIGPPSCPPSRTEMPQNLRRGRGAKTAGVSREPLGEAGAGRHIATGRVPALLPTCLLAVAGVTLLHQSGSVQT